jgi:D-alanyl-D-alanine-carboxypeptidase/D-alanyl-D-alanine-endopeptidase
MRAAFCLAAVSAVANAPLVGPAFAEDKLLDHSVRFAGTLAFLGAKVPGLIFAAVRNGETTVAGFGKISDGSAKEPDGDTLVRIGSVSKVFCGEVLAGLVSEGRIGLADRLQDRLGAEFAVPEKNGQPIRIIHLATHAAGLAREVRRPDAPANDPFGTNTREALIAGLKGDPFLFAPGTAVSYSNFGFDLLGAALSHAAGRPYATLLEERVLAPRGMRDTIFNPRPGDEARLMRGHDFDGSQMPVAPTPATIECAGGLYTTANDMLRWMSWHLDRFAAGGQAVRLLDHAAYLYRDGLAAAVGLDEAGEMDAMGLGWVVMMPKGNRPLLLQKSGGLQGTFAYVALAPTKGVGVFFAVNAFDLAAFKGMVEVANGLIAELAPR